MKIQEMLSSGRFFVAGHRGYMAKYPQNTLLSYQKGIEAGVDMIELDVRLSRDDVLMLLHDNDLSCTTDGTGPLEACTYRELSRLDAGKSFSPEFAGERIPTLQEFFQLLSGYPEMMVNVEVKPAPRALKAAELVVELTGRLGITDRCIYNSFDGEVIALFHDRYGLPTHGFPGEHMQNFTDGEGGTYTKMTSVGLRMDWATPERVQEFAGRDIDPWCWAPDTEELARQAIDNGLHLATCNDPLPMLRVAAERGRR